MAATQLSLLGQFEADLYEKVVERLVSRAHKSEAFDCEETIFERGPERSTMAADENRIRLRSTRVASNHQQLVWTMHILNKPESVRLSPEILSRTTISCSLAQGGDPMAFLSALGYRRKFTLFKRGVQFQRGVVLAQIYQLMPSGTTIAPLDPSSYILSLSALVVEPPRNMPSRSQSGSMTAQVPGPSAEELKFEAMERIREMKGSLKGLVELSRVE